MRAGTTKTSSGIVAIAVLLLVPLAGCSSSDRLPTSSIPTDDYRVRHPILLGQDTISADLFPSYAQGVLDRHSAKQIFTLAQDYKSFGHGPILVLFPARTPREIVAGVKAALAASGVYAPIEAEPYEVGNAALASPVRISFKGLKAKVGDQCGQWPRDLGSGTNVSEWKNEQYYNFGCASQKMIAAQTADPRDLVTPRGEDPGDTITSNRAIEKLRTGTDPTTAWKIKNSNIGSVGSE